MRDEWGSHERECSWEWDHLWFDHSTRADGNQDARRVRSVGKDAPEPTRKLLACLLLANASYARADGYECPKHGQWVSFLVGIPGNRVMHWSVSMDVASNEDLLTDAFKEAFARKATTVTVEQVGRLLKHFPAIAAAAIRAKPGSDSLAAALREAGLDEETSSSLAKAIAERTAGAPRRAQGGREEPGVQ